MLIIRYIEEHDEEQISVNGRICKMAEYLDGMACEQYTFKHTKQRLLIHFGDKIVITDQTGRSNVVTFRITATTTTLQQLVVCQN